MMNLKNMIVALSMLATGAVAAPAAEAGESHSRFDRVRGVVKAVYNSYRDHDRSPRFAETCRYIPGHHEDRVRQIWVEGYTKRVRVPAKFHEHRDAWGHMHREVVRRSYVRHVWVPGHYENRTVQVWVAARHKCRDVRHTHARYDRHDDRRTPRTHVAATPRRAVSRRPEARVEQPRQNHGRDRRTEAPRRGRTRGSS